MALLTKNEKKTPCVTNGFEKNCGTFKGGGRKLHCCQQHWVSLPRKRKVIDFFSKKNNDHGVDVSIVMVI